MFWSMMENIEVGSGKEKRRWRGGGRGAGGAEGARRRRINE